MACSKNKTGLVIVAICFSSVNDAKGKRKVLGSNQKLKFNPTELILYCKDLRIIRFCFHEAGPESAKKVSDAVLFWEVCVSVFFFLLPTNLTSLT